MTARITTPLGPARMHHLPEPESREVDHGQLPLCYSHLASYERFTRYCQVARFRHSSPGRQWPRRSGCASVDAWGEMGAAWGVAPAIARVHAYLMAPPGAADRARGPGGARAVAPSSQPGPDRRRDLGHRRAGSRAAPRRTTRAGRGRIPGDRRSLAMVRSGRGRAQGSRGRSDHRRPRTDLRGGRRGRRGEPRRSWSSPPCANGWRPSSSSSASSIGRSGSCPPPRRAIIAPRCGDPRRPERARTRGQAGRRTRTQDL